MLSFVTKAEGGNFVADRVEIRHAFSLFMKPGERRELRRLPGGTPRIISGDDMIAAVEAAAELSDGQVYWSLNPIRGDADRASKKTVTCRLWFLIDCDPVRPRDLSSTDDEKGSALILAGRAVDHLFTLGWPSPVIVDSGNGWHLLYRIDLPNEPLSQQILKAVLYRLGELLDGPEAVVDRSTHDAPRISKLPGTLARKGPDTPDRPHRPCRIVHEPASLDVVTVDLLKAAGAEPPAPTNGANGTHARGFETTASNGPGKDAYVRTAIDREVLRVALAPQGERNNILNDAAFRLGTLAGWPEMHAAEAREALRLAAERAGLSAHEIGLTIGSGWDAGAEKPRPRPVDAAANGRPRPAGALTILASSIRPQPVKWLWRNRVPVGFITVFAGRTGLGKSFVTCDLIARVTTGRDFTDAPAPGIGSVLMISEDPYEYVLAPRLIELGADLDRVRFLSWEAMATYSIDDTAFLARAVAEFEETPRLVVIDPPTNFLGDVDEHKNGEVRAALMQLVAWLQGKDIACIFITHVNKQGGKGIDALSRVIGSVAWVTTSRIAHLFCPDPEFPGRCLFVPSKNNLGPLEKALAYRIVPTEDLASVQWDGLVDVTADDAMNQEATDPKVARCEQYLIELFSTRLEWPANEVKAALKAKKFGRRQWDEATERLGVTIEPIKGARNQISGWKWCVPPDWEHFSEDV